MQITANLLLKNDVSNHFRKKIAQTVAKALIILFFQFFV